MNIEDNTVSTLQLALSEMRIAESALDGVLVALDILQVDHNKEYVDSFDVADDIGWYVEHDDIYSDYRLLKMTIELTIASKLGE